MAPARAAWVRRPASALRSRLLPAARRRLRIDTRSLAAFRVAVGLLLLADLLLRARNLTAFYTDAGVLPRSGFLDYISPWLLSVHIVSGTTWFEAALFALAGAFALALAVGYRTRTATVASWLLLISLQNRNPLVLNGGDVLLRLVLFWAIFLPLGARWSVDARHRGSTPQFAGGVPAAALLGQVVIMYTVNAAMKLSGTMWTSGVAIEYVFSLDQFTVLLGEVIAHYPLVLHALDLVWIAMVTTSVFLLVLTGWRRAAFAILFVGMHVGMLLTMRLGLFPLIAVAALLPFLTPAFWSALLSRLPRSVPATLDRVATRLAAALPTVTVDVPRFLARTGRVLRTVVPLVFLVLVVLWNLQTGGYVVFPDQAEPAVHLTRTGQYWNMFAPDPLTVDGWYVVPGTLSNGSRVDAFHRGPVEWDRPPELSATYPTARWRKYLVNLWRTDTVQREYFADYLCDRWNREHDVRMVNVSVYYMEQPTRLNGSEPVHRNRLVAQRCPL